MTRAQLSKHIFDLSHLTGEFRLRSGVVANEYFDKYRFEANPQVLKAIAEHLAELVPDDVEMLAGLELGGVPIATMLSQVTGLPTLFVRKKAKDYGTCKFAEGGDIKGKKLLIVEDVVTSGGQIIESCKALRGEGAIISDVVCVIDREAGGTEKLGVEGLKLHALFKMSVLKESFKV
jgi:orotate phosphoribosyltransferase